MVCFPDEVRAQEGVEGVTGVSRLVEGNSLLFEVGFKHCAMGIPTAQCRHLRKFHHHLWKTAVKVTEILNVRQLEFA